MASNSTSNINKGVSVIICCYNSAERLPQTLEHLARQYLPSPLIMEIIVVDNASTDNTTIIANDFFQLLRLENVFTKIVHEPQPGQMFARKRGVLDAKFEHIVFCDDDNWPDNNYVLLASGLMDKDAAIGAGGGQNLPVTNAEVYPEWFNEFKNYYGLGIPADNSGDVSHRTYMLGAGMVTRKSLFLKVFDDKYPTLLKGRDGNNLSTGDDFEYCKRLLLWGYKLYYEEKMILYHFIPKERLTIDYRDRLLKGIHDAGKVLEKYDLAIKIFNKTKNKNRLRLVLLAPVRIALSKLKLSRRVLEDEQLTWDYLSPFYLKEDFTMATIKKFIHHK